MGDMAVSWVGPCVVAASVGYVYSANRSSDGSFPLSTSTYCMLLFFLYASGSLPRSPLFPSTAYKANIFGLLYKLYCSDSLGYRVLKPVLHQSSPYPHSDYRVGIRMLSGRAGASGVAHRRLVRRAPVSAADAVAAAASGGGSGSGREGEAESYYGRGADYVDLALLRQRRTDRAGGVMVVPVALFADNYAYLIISLDTHKAAAVDPADPKAVRRALAAIGKYVGATLELTDVLTTHKHWDHAGGNKDLLEAAASEANRAAARTGENDVAVELAVVGPAMDRPMGCNRLVRDGDVFTAAGGAVTVRVLEAPGHTVGSVLYLVGDSAAAATAEKGAQPYAALFTGDSLFSGGCGAPFETTRVAQVKQTRHCFVTDPRVRTHPASNAALDDNHVLLFVGHEYTERLLEEMHTITTRRTKQANCQVSVIAYGRLVDEELARVKEMRVASDGLEDAANMGVTGQRAPAVFTLPACTVPSTLAIEKRINPLLTMDASALDLLESSSEALDNMALEQAIYCSRERVLPSS